MVYHKVLLNPTHGQMSDLADGNEVKLAHHHIAGDVEFHLTTAQVKKLTAAHAAGRGCTLKLSKPQVKHMLQHGGGKFRDFLSHTYDALKPSLAKGVDMGLTYAKDKAVHKINHLAGFTQHGEGWLGDIGKALGHGAVDFVAKTVGAGVKPKRRQQHGKGWLGDIGKALGHGAVDFVADKLGGSVAPNPLANHNEKLRSALFQKKGAGLYQ